MHDFEVWTDGSCSGNPGPGGYAAYIKSSKANSYFNPVAICGAEAFTTNNRMELQGFISALSFIHACNYPTKQQIKLHTDSKYVENAVNCGWLAKWQKKGYGRIKNVDLWRTAWDLLNLLSVTVVWVKGHSGNIENDLVDRLAVEARDGVHGKYSLMYF